MAFINCTFPFLFAAGASLQSEVRESHSAGAFSARTVDSHFHIFSPEAKQTVNGVPFGNIGAKEVLQQLDAAGIDGAAIYSAAYFFQDRRQAEHENDFASQTMAANPARLIGFCSVPVQADWAVDEIDRCAKVLHLKGLKIHPQANGLDLRVPESLAKIDPLIKKAGSLGMAVVFDSIWLDSRVTLKMFEIV